MMKRLSMFVALACLGLAVPMCVQADDQYVTYDGTTYKVVGDNLVTNGDFSDGLNNWLGGDGNDLSTDYYTVSADADATTGTNYITTNGSYGDYGSSAAQSICTLWSIDASKTYYFSAWTKKGDDTGSGYQSFFINDNYSSNNGSGESGNEQHILHFTNQSDEFVQSTIVFKASDYATGDYASAEYIYAGLRLSRLPEGFSLSNVELYEVEEVSADPENPLDITSSVLVNPDGTSSIGTGWTTNSGFQLQSSSYTNGDVTISSFFESYGGSTSTAVYDYTLSQKVTLPAGEYRLTADAIAVLQSSHLTPVTGVYLFAGDEQTSVSTYDGLPENFSVDFAVTDDDVDGVEVGFMTVSTNANWVAVDNFKLYYLGTELSYDYFELSALVTEASELVDAIGVEDADLSAAITAAQAALDDDQSDAETLADALSTLQDALQAYKIANASEDYPVDMTESLGYWTGGGNYGNVAQLEENFDASMTTGEKLSQTITDLPAGVYEVKLYCVANYANDVEADGTPNAPTGASEGDEVVTVKANDATAAVTLGLKSGTNTLQPNYAVSSLDDVDIITVSNVIVEEDGTLSLSISVDVANAVNWILVGNYSLTYLGAAEEEEEEPDEPEETASDDEYAEGDIITIGKAKYQVTGANLFTNGGFEDGVNGWTASNDYKTEADADNFTLTEEGGFNGGAYLSSTSDAGSSDSSSPTQAVEVTEGSTYVLIGYTKGTTPAATNLQYNGLFNLKYDETTEAFSEDGTITEFNWGAEVDGSATDWTQTLGAFKATHDYVGIKMAHDKGASFDGFQLYEVEPVETVGDTEYAADDVVTIDGTTYQIVTGENLVQNGGFEEELSTEDNENYTVTGWTAGSTSSNGNYTNAADASKFTLTDACGFNGKQFLTQSGSSLDFGIDHTPTLTQAIAVEAGKTYLFVGYTSGTAPKTDNVQYCGIGSLTANGDDYTDGSMLASLNWGANYATTSGSNTYSHIVCWWTETDKVFTVPAEDDANTYDHVGIRFSWSIGSFDGFQLYEVEQTTFTVDDVKEALEGVTVPTANIGTDAFQYDPDAVAALSEAYETAKAMVDAATTDDTDNQDTDNQDTDTETVTYTSADYYAAITALQEAAEAAAVLNEPADGQVFNIIMESENSGAVGNALKSIYEADKTNGGKFDFQFSAEPNANLAAQLYTFTPVEDVTNGYTISFVASDDNTYYLCTGAAYPTLSNNASGIRATGDVDNGTEVGDDAALIIVVKATDTEGVWNLYNTEAEANLGINSNGDSTHSLYTDNALSDIKLAEALDEIEWKLEADYGTLMLPFVPDENEIDGLTFYSTEAYSTEPELSLVEVETLAANTPYIVKGTADTEYTFAVKARTFDTEATAGWLTGVYESTSVPTDSYVLQNQEDEDGLAFYIVTEDAAISLGANHCYLTVTGTSDETTNEGNAEETNAPAVVYFPGSGKATAITGVEANVADAEAVYDLSGRKVSRPQHGIYIKGGKKVVIK